MGRFCLRLCGTLVLMVWGGPLSAGVYYKAVTTSVVDGKESPQIVVESYVEGLLARIEFRENPNPLTPAGTYLLTRDGGQTIYLVNPEDGTYAAWDVRGMLQFTGRVMKALGPVMKMEISEPEVEKLVEQDGGTVAGLPTRHYRYKTTYSMKIKVIGLGRSSKTETIQDVWVTTELDDLAMGVWLQKEPAPTGDEQLDKLIATEMEKVNGLALRTETESVTTSGKKGKKQSGSHTVTEVTELRRGESFDPKLFELGADLKPITLQPVAAQGQ